MVLLFTVFNAGAVSQNDSFSRKIEYEQKIFSNATIDDDFCGRYVLVVLDRNISKINEVHEKSFFGDFPVEEIVDNSIIVNEAMLTDDDYRHIPDNGSWAEEFIEKQNQFDAARQTQESKDFQENVQDIGEHWQINRETFRQVLSIKLPIDCKQNVLDVIKKLEKIDGIRSASPSYYRYPLSTNPDDPAFRRIGLWAGNEGQWPLYANRLNMAGAWAVTTGSKNIRVGVIDSGIFPHDDLIGNLVSGWNFENDNNNTNDTHGHGTSTAGIIGAVGHNGIGITGVAQNISLVPLKVDFHPSTTYPAITYATNHNIPILNASYGGGRFCPSEEQLIENYPGLFVAGAGNGGVNRGINNDTAPNRYYPASYALPNIISVGATLQNDRKGENRPWGHSNYGSRTVHLFAPTETWSTCARSGVNVACGNMCTSTPARPYCIYGGTSAAAPHVAGVAALILSRYPMANTQHLKWAILEGVDKIPSLERCPTLGIRLCVTGGRLNAHKALQLAPLRPNMRYGIHHIISAVRTSDGRSRYLEFPHNNNTNITISVPINRFIDNFGYLYIVQMVNGNSSNNFQIRGLGWNAVSDPIRQMGRNASTNNATMVQSTSLTSNLVTVMENVDGTFTFLSGGLALGIVNNSNANNATVQWQTHNALNESQKWHLEPHRLNYMYMRGDLNQDGRVNSLDLALMQQFISNSGSASALQYFLADLNRDGRVTSADFVLLAQMVT
jgi:subtilisin family serine protease